MAVSQAFEKLVLKFALKFTNHIDITRHRIVAADLFQCDGFIRANSGTVSASDTALLANPDIFIRAVFEMGPVMVDSLHGTHLDAVFTHDTCVMIDLRQEIRFCRISGIIEHLTGDQVRAAAGAAVTDE